MRSSQTLGRCLWLQTLPERSDENWPNRPITSPHEEHPSETSASPVDERLHSFYSIKHISMSHKSFCLFSKVKITLTLTLSLMTEDFIPAEVSIIHPDEPSLSPHERQHDTLLELQYTQCVCCTGVLLSLYSADQMSPCRIHYKDRWKFRVR